MEVPLVEVALREAGSHRHYSCQKRSKGDMLNCISPFGH